MSATRDERRAENDRRVAADIEKYGCHVISVFDPDQQLPTFTYSVGIQASSGAPEAIVLGVPSKLGHAMVNLYKERVRRGERFERSTPYTGFLEGFTIFVEPAKPSRLVEYTLGCTRFYGSTTYAVVQLIYPTTSGVWPWQKSASAAFKASQPMLGRKYPHRR